MGGDLTKNQIESRTDTWEKLFRKLNKNNDIFAPGSISGIPPSLISSNTAITKSTSPAVGNAFSSPPGATSYASGGYSVGSPNNPGLVYAPYIPLSMTDDAVDKNITDGMVSIAVPLWMGEVRTGGFHELVGNAFRNNLNPKMRDVVNDAIWEFNDHHAKEKSVIRIIGSGPNMDTVLDMVSIFDSIFIDNVTDLNPDWTTPVRAKFFIPNENLSMSNRMIYGGHFYVTGDAECAGDHSSEVEKIEIKNLFWEDYRNKKGAMKIL